MGCIFNLDPYSKNVQNHRFSTFQPKLKWKVEGQWFRTGFFRMRPNWKYLPGLGHLYRIQITGIDLSGRGKKYALKLIWSFCVNHTAFIRRPPCCVTSTGGGNTGQFFSESLLSSPFYLLEFWTEISSSTLLSCRIYIQIILILKWFEQKWFLKIINLYVKVT